MEWLEILFPRVCCPYRRLGKFLHVFCHHRVWDEIWVRIWGDSDNIYIPILNNLVLQVHLPWQPFHTTFECNLVAWLHSRARHRLPEWHRHETRHQRREHHFRALCWNLPVNSKFDAMNITQLCTQPTICNLGLTDRRTSPGSIRPRVGSTNPAGAKMTSQEIPFPSRGSSSAWQPIVLAVSTSWMSDAALCLVIHSFPPRYEISGPLEYHIQFRDFLLPVYGSFHFQASFYCTRRRKQAWEWNEPHTGKKEISELNMILQRSRDLMSVPTLVPRRWRHPTYRSHQIHRLYHRVLLYHRRHILHCRRHRVGRRALPVPLRSPRGCGLRVLAILHKLLLRRTLLDRVARLFNSGNDELRSCR